MPCFTDSQAEAVEAEKNPHRVLNHQIEIDQSRMRGLQSSKVTNPKETQLSSKECNRPKLPHNDVALTRGFTMLAVSQVSCSEGLLLEYPLSRLISSKPIA